MFAKVFSQIFDSSIAENYEVRHVFEDLLKLADRDGVVDMTPEAIHRRTNVPLEKVQYGLTELCKPDMRSRSKEHEGRRLMLIDSHRDWGWQIVNYQHYREIQDEESRRAYFRDAKRQQRADVKPKKKAKHRYRQTSGPLPGEIATMRAVANGTLCHGCQTSPCVCVKECHRCGLVECRCENDPEIPG